MNKPAAAVLYHYPCPDGAFAALAAHLYFSAASRPAIFFPNTVYNPIKPDHLPLRHLTDVYLLDFVGPPGFVHLFSSKVPRVVILDHHKTALEALGGDDDRSVGENVRKVIDMNRSGATIAFDYFKEKLARSDDDSGDETKKKRAMREFERMRPIFEYIEDGDLWRWKLENSKAFSSGLKDLNIEFSTELNPSLFDELLSLDLKSVIRQGMVSLSVKQKLIDDTLGQSYKIALGGGNFGHCLAVDADSVSELRSELGHQLAIKSRDLKLRGIGAVVYRVPELENDQLLKISLRSVECEDTTAISQEFGGGGHRNASSFMISFEEFKLWKVD
ncbi:hypothetical protein Tsubulata_046714 [Turnera subulata]|uniref:DHHA1 domain-containing protein n=1 Tax=Turnera subulata TaxID=218843 RepID=A0A9Q0FPL8_9ROSI|nr:hypothetical protein Tsubulata_046714 [Turnera subulata]